MYNSSWKKLLVLKKRNLYLCGMCLISTDKGTPRTRTHQLERNFVVGVFRVTQNKNNGVFHLGPIAF